MREILLYFSIKYDGDWEKIYNALESKEKVDRLQIDSVVNIEEKYITILDDEYPKNLLNINKPPFVIFYKGNIDLLYSKNILWVFGSYLDAEMNKYIKTLNSIDNFILLSGIENIVEKNILTKMSNPKKIIVKNDGIANSTIFDNEIMNNENILIISEYPLTCISTYNNWLESNKIKTGISTKMCLINSKKSKEFFKILLNFIETNKEILCIKNKKSDITNHNNMLISQGAISIEKNDLEHIFKNE